MFLIKPLGVTGREPRNLLLPPPDPGVGELFLLSSSVAYPEQGFTVVRPEYGWPVWTYRYRDMPTDPWYEVHLGALYRQVGVTPAHTAGDVFPDVLANLPPGHPDLPAGVWVKQASPRAWDTTYSGRFSEGELCHFPLATYKTIAQVTSENPSITSPEALVALASVPVKEAGYEAYPYGTFRRNEKLFADYQSSFEIHNASSPVPVFGSDYWEQVEPPASYVKADLDAVPLNGFTVYLGEVYRKRVAGVTDSPPPANPVQWARLYATNRWSMFSRSAQEQTRVQKPASGPAVITVALQAHSSDLIDAVALLNLEATSVRVQVQDSTLATVYDRTVELEVIGMATPDWYEFLTAPRYYQDKVLLTDIPGTTGARITITITNDDATAACGNCIVGKRVELGISLTNAQVGFTDYSVKTVDEWGNVDVQERGFADRVTLPVDIPNYLLEPLKRTLLQFRATPALYVGSPELPSSIVYGWFKSLEVTIPFPDNSQYSLEIESTS